MEEANDAFLRLGRVLEGVGNILAIKVAPFITAATNSIVKLAIGGNNLGKVMENVFNFIVDGFGRVIDAVKIVQAAFFIFMAAVKTSLAIVSQFLGEMLEGVERVKQFLGGTADFTVSTAFKTAAIKFANEAAASLDKALKAFGDGISGKTSKRLKRIFKEIAAEAQKRAEDTVAVISGDKGPNRKRFLENRRLKREAIKGSAAQFNLALVGFRGINLNKEGKQIDEQKKTNKILRRIERGFRVQAIVAQ